MKTVSIFLIISIAANVLFLLRYFDRRHEAKDPLRNAISIISNARNGSSPLQKPTGYYAFSDRDFHSIWIFNDDQSVQNVVFCPEGKWRIDSQNVVETAQYLSNEFEYFGSHTGSDIIESQGDYDNVFRKVMFD